MFGLAFVILLVAVAAVGPFLTRDPTQVNFQEKNLPPVGLSIEQSVYDLETEEFMPSRTAGTGVGGRGHFVACRLYR